MRIVAGAAKGRIIGTPEGNDTRPTTDKVREAIFGKLQFEIPGSHVLDLFAGSGAMGIEAMSRGAEKCVFVEKNRNAMRIVKKNAELCGFNKQSTFINADFEKAVAALDEVFDFIFIDPPYKSGFYEKAFELSLRLLKEDGVIVAEHEDEIIIPDCYEVYAEKKYSRICVSYIRKK